MLAFVRVRMTLAYNFSRLLEMTIIGNSLVIVYITPSICTASTDRRTVLPIWKASTLTKRPSSTSLKSTFSVYLLQTMASDSSVITRIAFNIRRTSDVPSMTSYAYGITYRIGFVITENLCFLTGSISTLSLVRVEFHHWMKKRIAGFALRMRLGLI